MESQSENPVDLIFFLMDSTFKTINIAALFEK